MAEQTITSPLILAFLGKEAPVDGNSTRVSDDGLGHTPQEHEEEDVENDQQYDVWGGLEMEHVLDHEHKVVERYEQDHSREVRRQHLRAVYLSVAHAVG